MKTFIPAETFDAYPLGTKVRFTEGVEAGPYANDFVDLMVEKGLVKGEPAEAEKGTRRPAEPEPANGDGRSVADIPAPADPSKPADMQKPAKG